MIAVWYDEWPISAGSFTPCEGGERRGSVGYGILPYLVKE